MDSPIDISPSSTPSSGTPPAEEINFQATSGGHYDKGFMSNLTSQITSSFGGSGSKRRFGGGASYASGHGHGSSRDAKSRRRENSGRQDSSGGGLYWEGRSGGGKREKDELLDQPVVDYLRKEIGDPFLEPASR